MSQRSQRSEKSPRSERASSSSASEKTPSHGVIRWAKVNAASVHQENIVQLMQVDMLQLGVLQTQMDNLSVQATLIIGFALSMWAGETLTPLLEDDSQLCIWKSWYHLIFATFFFMLVALCISCCLIIVSMVSYIKQAAQEAALIVSTGAAVSMTRYHLRSLTYLFVLAYSTFTCSAALLIILYVGMPKRVHMQEPPEGWGTELDSTIELFDGTVSIMCLDPRAPDGNSLRDGYGACLAGANTLVILSMSFWGYCKFKAVRISYRPLNLLSWYVHYQTEQKEKASAVQNLPNRGKGGKRSDIDVEVDSTDSQRGVIR